MHISLHPCQHMQSTFYSSNSTFGPQNLTSHPRKEHPKSTTPYIISHSILPSLPPLSTNYNSDHTHSHNSDQLSSSPMRAGGCTVQQGLTADAANVVKQALALARRRGHAQVTPLHVANTMLSTSNGLFRTACLQSHSHPLQCKALELCFNVALNRLPATSSGHILAGPHSGHHYPTISNALVAAFKRAQAHQRRGSVENQQQPLLAVKIELEQLIISILDDPSVSRVMREAGFSSTQVKANVEQTVTLESPPPPLTNISKDVATNSKPSIPPRHPFKDDDVLHVAENMLKYRRKSVVVVGECVSALEGVVGGMMEKVEKGEEIAVEGLRGVKCISVSLSSFSDLQREDVEQKIAELTCLVRSLVGKGVILYLGDLKWITDFRASFASRARNYYCGVEHMIMELGRLVYGMSEHGRLWLMGIATFQTFMRCRNGQHSLESLWGLHPITLPAASLDLSLRNGSDIESRSKIAKSSSCSATLENSSLPSWLKDESKRLKNNDISLEKTLTFSPSSSPSSSTSFFSYDHQHHQNNNNNPIISTTSTPNSASSSDLMEMEYVPRFKEFNAENLNILCNALERKVPRQKDIVPALAGTILQCRSGMMRRKEKQSSNTCNVDREVKVETWLFFLGCDAETKERVARELAKVVFGSHSNFVKISLNHQDYSSRSSSTKRVRDDQKGLAQEIAWNPHRVFLVEDLELADFQSQMGIKRAIQRGKIISDADQEVSLCDAIVIFSSDTFSFSDGLSPRACSPTVKQKLDSSSSLSLDLNISIGDDDDDGDDDIRGILDIVDRRIVFNNDA